MYPQHSHNTQDDYNLEESGLLGRDKFISPLGMGNGKSQGIDAKAHTKIYNVIKIDCAIIFVPCFFFFTFNLTFC